MQLLQPSMLTQLAAISLLLGLDGLASATPNTPFCGLKPGIAIKSSQRLQGDEFIGKAVAPNRLRPKTQYNPRTYGATHLDGGNTRSQDYPGPLGHDLNITSTDIRYGQLLWDDKGTPYASYGGPCNGSDTNIAFAIAVLNPKTFRIETTWQLPAKYGNSSTPLNSAYASLLVETDEIVVNLQKGQIFILKKHQDARGSPSIELRRTIDLAPSGVLKGNSLLNSMMDSAGNIWFTTGTLGAATAGTVSPTNSSIIGYVKKDGTIHSLEIPESIIENGIAVSNTTIFVVTGPAGKSDHANAKGTVGAFQPGPDGVYVRWNSTYEAGDGHKPGSFARGCGTTPGLLGNDFIAFGDNANVQMNLKIFRQDATGQDVKPICTFPVFKPNASWTDNSFIRHYDGKNHGVILQNMDHEIPYDLSFNFDENNGAKNNNLTVQSPGMQKIVIAGDGSGCHLAWTNPTVRMNTAPVLSTATGLIYGYEQSKDLANEGQWIWYANAISYKTGKEVWRARTGAGSTFNNYYRTAYLGPDGVFYHPVQNGVVAVRDGARAGGYGGY